jgi:hypothetical protein
MVAGQFVRHPANVARDVLNQAIQVERLDHFLVFGAKHFG